MAWDMQTTFKSVTLRVGATWAVVLTTNEGDDHQIDGFATAEDARSWAERETGQTLSTAFAGSYRQ
jgi:hypothetical protein